MLFQISRRVFGLATLAFTLLAQSADISLSQAKGIYREGSGAAAGSRADRGITFDVQVNRDGEWTPASTRFEFRSGDKFRFRLQTNREGYIYLLNRTFNGDANQLEAKGIERVASEDRTSRPSGPTYRLLYPLKSDGNRVAANRWISLPGDGGAFSMDNRPGVEKLHIVVSDKPLRLNDYFSVESGEIRTSRSNQPSNRRPNTQDTDDDILSQLNGELAAYGKNAQMAFVEEKGIIREGGDSQSYGVVRDNSKPAQFEIVLRHLPR